MDTEIRSSEVSKRQKEKTMLQKLKIYFPLYITIFWTIRFEVGVKSHQKKQKKMITTKNAIIFISISSRISTCVCWFSFWDGGAGISIIVSFDGPSSSEISSFFGSKYPWFFGSWILLTRQSLGEFLFLLFYFFGNFSN